MAYKLRILEGIADAERAALIAQADAGITADGSWERFFEVRMSAGPTVRLTADGSVGYTASVSWGSQHANLNTRTLQSAIECADRLAYAFHEMRAAKMVRD
jgi:hypothetical protein